LSSKDGHELLALHTITSEVLQDIPFAWCDHGLKITLHIQAKVKPKVTLPCGFIPCGLNDMVRSQEKYFF